MRIERYTLAHKDVWDSFVKESKNGTFLFLRDYMDYHANRFPDHSLLAFSDEGKLLAILPATAKDKTHITSHAGLTYGGLVMSRQSTIVEVCRILESMLIYLREEGFKEFIYKAVPHIYHQLPSEEDLYALTQVCRATLVKRMASTVIDFSNQLPIRERRQRYIRAALRKGLEIVSSTDFAAFWPILNETLKRKYQALAVHTLDEIKLLHSHFPNNIHLWLAQQEGETLSGAVLFVTDTCVHAQYLCSSPRGDDFHANEVMVNHILQHYSPLHYFDFGTSADTGAYGLNESLIAAKQSYGCRTIVYDTYKIDIF